MGSSEDDCQQERGWQSNSILRTRVLISWCFWSFFQEEIGILPAQGDRAEGSVHRVKGKDGCMKANKHSVALSKKKEKKKEAWERGTNLGF